MLVSGGDTPLGNSIIQQALESFNVAATTAGISRPRGGGRAKQPPVKQESESLVLVPWSRQSPVSARNVVLRTVGSFESIDQAVVVHNLTNEKRLIHQLPLNSIQEITDVQLKSYLFLAKELMTHFLAKGRGGLALVVDCSGQQELTTMDSLVTEGFVSLARSLMSSYHGDPVAIKAFESSSTDARGYASFILDTLKESGGGGKWFHFGEKSSLFRSGRRARGRRS